MVPDKYKGYGAELPPFFGGMVGYRRIQMLNRMTSLVVAAAFVLVSTASAHASEIRVLASNGVKAAVEAMQPQFERTSGHKLSIEFTTAASLKQRIEKGEEFDVAILTDEVVNDLVKSGHLIGYRRAALARVGIGVGFRKGAARPDVRTAASIKQALLSAKSVTYTREGASRPAIDKLFASLGIASTIEPKAHLTGPGQAPELVARGESEFVLTLISEILPAPGVELAGPLPPEFQSYISFSAAPSSNPTDTNAAQAFVAFLDGAGAAGAYKTAGMEPVK